MHLKTIKCLRLSIKQSLMEIHTRTHGHTCPNVSIECCIKLKNVYLCVVVYGELTLKQSGNRYDNILKAIKLRKTAKTLK